MEAVAVEGIPEVGPGDDLPALLSANADLRDGDVLCVASTVVSKAAGRLAPLSSFAPGPRARAIANRLAGISGERKDPRFAQAVLDESAALVMEAPFLLAETHFGHIAVNAGIDRSNVGRPDGDARDPEAEHVLLLPRRPDEHAQAIREAVATDVRVVVTDTCGRPFRHGQTGVAIGWDGLPASRDWRGTTDRDGYELGVTVEAVVDELAATANLVMGEGDGGTPAVVVRDWSFGNLGGSDQLFRDVGTDFVRQALRGWSYDGGASGP